MTPDQPGDGQIGRGTAVTALASLTQLAEATVSGVMLILQQKGSPPEVSQLLPTDRALPVLSVVTQEAATSYADCEVIDYEPAKSTADGQVMWVGVDAVPLLKAIVDESADMAGMPPSDPGKSKLSNLQLAAMRAETGGTMAVFVQSLRGNQVVAQSRRGRRDRPSWHHRPAPERGNPAPAPRYRHDRYWKHCGLSRSCLPSSARLVTSMSYASRPPPPSAR